MAPMNILVFAEVRDGKLKQASLESVSEAARLARASGGTAAAALVGEGIRSHAEALGRHGASKVYVVESPRLKHYAPEAYAKAVVEAATKHGAGAVLMAATSLGSVMRWKRTVSMYSAPVTSPSKANGAW